MQKIILIALIVASVYAAAGTATTPISAGKGAGYYVVAGVSIKCHASCATCIGQGADKCVTCAGTGFTAPAATGGACTCATKVGAAATTAAVTALSTRVCSATVADANICKTLDMILSTDTCVECFSNCAACTASTTGACAADAAATTTTPFIQPVKGCWGGVALAADGACGYVVGKSYLVGSQDTFVQSATAGEASALLGYFYSSTTFTYTACKPGCSTCTSATAGCTCATGWSPKATAEDGCECPAGNFETEPVATAGSETLGACTKCPAGCTACTSATVCSACDSSTHKLGSTTSTSSTCESIADTSATTSTDDTTTTSGTADGETSATATATNGVLITAASMLLAVILA